MMTVRFSLKSVCGCWLVRLFNFFSTIMYLIKQAARAAAGACASIKLNGRTKFPSTQNRFGKLNRKITHINLVRINYANY